MGVLPRLVESINAKLVFFFQIQQFMTRGPVEDRGCYGALGHKHFSFLFIYFS